MLNILQVVTLASASGKYGGPFEVATGQQETLNNSGVTNSRILAGTFVGDEPVLDKAILLPVRRWLPLRGFVAMFSWAIACAVPREIKRSDVVHVSFARELIPLYAAACTLLLGRRLILQPHGMLTTGIWTPFHVLVDLMARPIARRAETVLALTDVEAASLHSWLGRDKTPNRIIVIGNPVLTVRRRVLEAPPTTLFAARLHPRKRVNDFLEAAALTKSETVFVVAGADQGDRALVEAARIKDRVKYLGAISQHEVLSWLASVNSFVLPSIDEPWGNTLATAVASGIPVVVTESAALSGWIRDHGAGLVVPDGDAVALAAAVDEISLKFFVVDPDAGHKFLTRYGPRSFSDALLKVVHGD